MLNNPRPLIEPADLEIEDLMAEIEVLDGLLVAVHHHVAAADIVQKDCVFS